MPTALEQAALARAAAVPQPFRESRAHRPKDRRRSVDGPANWTPVMRAKIEVRDAAKGLDFSGYASVTEAPYEMYDFFGPYTEVVSRGSFGKTLAQKDLDVPLVLQHDSLRRIARTTNGTLQLSEDDQGLLALAQLDPADADVAYIAPKMRSGLIDEMSFMFSITAGQWSPDYTEYRIDSVDIHRGDVAIVGYGANPATASELRSAVFSAGPLVDELDTEERLALYDELVRVMDMTVICAECGRADHKPTEQRMTLQDLLTC